MLFISGPRQVGKTTLAKLYCDSQGGGVYVNWDIITDQKKIVRNPYFFEEEKASPNQIVVFDEIHKYARWKNYLKGAYDRCRDTHHFIVTGSGRLDLFKKGGDSLLGRYLSLPMFPFTLSELADQYTNYADFREYLVHGAPCPQNAASRKDYETLFEFSGFPEPFLKGEKSAYNIWHQDRKNLLIRQDIRDATNIREISLLEILSHLISGRIGSLLSINALREDVGAAFETVRDWISILGQFYYLFQLKPYTGSLSRTIRKECKAYLFDWAEIDDPAIRFENFIALHLLKAVQTWRSLGDGDLKLCFIRDREKREVDFTIVEKDRVVCLIEAKASDEECSPNLLYFQEKLKVPVAVQVLHKPNIHRKLRRNDKIQWIVSADIWLTCLP
jgi:predicted AAA+ superfamily ATPase